MDNNNEKKICFFRFLTEDKSREISGLMNSIETKSDLNDMYLGMSNLMKNFNEEYMKKLSELELKDSMELDKLRKIKELLDN